MATLISVIAYIFGGIVEISIGDRSLSDLWGQFKIWHFLSVALSLFIATSNSLKVINSSKWFKSVIILVPVPLFMWASDFWSLGIGEKDLFSWTAVVAFVSIFYFFTSGLKGVDNFLMEVIDSDAGIAIKIIRHCKRNNQRIIYAGGDVDNFSNTLNLLKNAAVKEGYLEMVFDIGSISDVYSLIDGSEFIFENNCKVEAILYEIYNKGLMKKFRDLDEFALKVDPENTLKNENEIEAHYIHTSNYINDIKIPILTPEYLREKCLSKYKNDLYSASLIYAFFFNLPLNLDREICFCTKQEVEIFNKKIIKKIPYDSRQETESFHYSGVLLGLWNITNSFKNDSKKISNQSIKALCFLQKIEVYWPIVSYTFEDDLFLSKLSKSMSVENLELSYNEILGIYNILFTLGEYTQAKSLLESTALSYEFSWEYKSNLLKVQQRLISQNIDTDLADKEYYNLFMNGYNNIHDLKEGSCESLGFINNLVWVGTRVKEDEELFSKIVLPISELLNNAEQILSRSVINNIPPNEIWHFHNNSANLYERLLEFNQGNCDYLERAVSHYYKSIHVQKIDIKWLSGSLINYAMFVSNKDNKSMINNIQLQNGYTSNSRDVLELARLSYKYKSQIYDLDEVKYPREFLEKNAG